MSFDQPIITPITLSSIFAMQKPSSNKGHQYSRVSNPTRNELEKKLATLENAQHASVFSSGSAAITTVMHLFHAGDRIICHQQLYEGSQRILKTMTEQFGLAITYLDLTEPEEALKQIKNPTSIKAIWFETVTNPLLEVMNIQKINKLAKKLNCLIISDNTLANPLQVKPLNQGADLVIESLSKIINGHSDVIAGMIATNNTTLANKIKTLQHTMGSILSPFDSFLILRSLSTLAIRNREQQKNAKRIVKKLRQHQKLKKVIYPGFGNITSFQLRNSREADKFITQLKTIKIAHSFGGTETVIQQPARMMDLDLSSPIKIKPDLFRLSIGLEKTKLIINDLNQALNSLLK